MSQDKKTIHLANEVAEEGDRVIYIEDDQRIPGVYKYDPSMEHPWRVIPNEFEDSLAIWEDSAVLAFGPTDALEAVEEAIDMDKEDFGRIGKRELIELIKYRINQKRKGHE